MIVNNLKTKAMKFGRKSQFTFSFHGQKIDVVNNYKYLGNILSSTGHSGSDLLRETYDYLGVRGRNTWFDIRQKIIRLGGLPTKSMLYIFQTIIAPILTYGSDVWGISKSAKVGADRMFLKCAKGALGVKYNTSNVMVYGECGTFPPSVICDINVICFYNRLKNMSSNRLARIVLNELEYLHHNGFRTWVTDVHIYHKRMVLKTLTWIAIPSKHTARNWYGENLSNLGNVSLKIWIKTQFYECTN